MVPFLAEQRASLLEKDKRLLATLRDSHERDFIYDLLSENEESLAAHLADLAGQRGLLWARVESDDIDLAATADRDVIRDLLGEEATAFAAEPTLALLVRANGEADLVGAGGRPLLKARPVARAALPVWRAKAAEPWFEDSRWNGRAVLYFGSRLAAAGRAVRAAAPALLARRRAAQPGPHPHPLLRPGRDLVRPPADPPEPADLADRDRTRTQRAAGHVAGGHGRPRGASFPCTRATSSGPWPTPSTAWWASSSPPSARSSTTATTSRPWSRPAPTPSRSPRPTSST